MGLKSIFDGIYVDQLIQKDGQGGLILYPHGMFGPGYTLPAEREAGMRARLRSVMLVSLIGGIAFAMLLMRVMEQAGSVTPLGWIGTAATGTLLLGSILIYQRRLAIGLRRIDGPRPSLSEWLRRARQSRAPWTFWFNAILGAIVALASVASIGVGISSGEVLVTSSGIILLFVGVLAVWDGIVGLRERRTAA